MRDPAQADMIVAIFAEGLSTTANLAGYVREWSSRYPDLSAELAALATEYLAGDIDPPVDAPLAAEQAELMQRLASASRDRSVLEQSRSQASVSEASPVETVPQAAALRGLAYPNDLAKRLRLPASILERIVAHGIALSTVPAVLIEQMADALDARSADVLRWLSGASSNPASPAFVRETKTGYAAAPSFSDLIANSTEIDSDDRDYWRSVQSVSRELTPEE